MNREEIVREENNRAGQILLDWAELQETCLNKESLIDKLLGLYLQQLPAWVADMKTAVATRNVESLRRVCHTIKGATAAIHAAGCVHSLGKLHSYAHTGDFTHMDEALAEAIAVLEKTGLLIGRILKG